MSMEVAQLMNSSIIDTSSNKIACSLDDSSEGSLSTVTRKMSGQQHIAQQPPSGTHPSCSSMVTSMHTSTLTPNALLKPAHNLDTSANPLLSYIGSFTRSLPLPFLPPSIVSMLHQASRPSVVSQHSRIVAKFITSPQNAVWYASEAIQDDSGVYVSSNNELITTLNFPPISASISPIHEVPSLVTSNGLNYSPTTSNIPKLPRTITDIAHWYYDSQRFIQSCYPSHHCLLAVEDKLIETAFGEVISVLGSQQASSPNSSSMTSLLSLQSLNTPSTPIPNSQTLFFDAQRDNTLTMEYITGRLHAARAISAFCKRTASHDLPISLGNSLRTTIADSVPKFVPEPEPVPRTGNLPKSPSRRRLTTEISSLPPNPSRATTVTSTGVGTAGTAVTLTNSTVTPTDIPPTQRWAQANTQLASLHARLTSVSSSLDTTAALISAQGSSSDPTSTCTSISRSIAGASAGVGTGSSTFPCLSSLQRQPSLALRQTHTHDESNNSLGSKTFSSPSTFASASRNTAIDTSTSKPTSLSARKGATGSLRRATTRISSSSLADTSGAVARGYGSMAEVATLLNAMHLHQNDGDGRTNVRQMHESARGSGGTSVATSMSMSSRNSSNDNSGNGNGTGNNMSGSEEMCVGVRGRTVITLSTLLTSLWEDRRRISRAREEARVRASVARAMSVATDAVYQARRVGTDAVQRERTLRNTVQLDMGRARGELASLRSVSDATAVAAAARELEMSRHVARLEEENKRLLKTQRELEGLVHAVHIREETEQQRRAEAEARVEEVWEGRKRLLAVLREWRERARIVTGEVVRMCGDDSCLPVRIDDDASDGTGEAEAEQERRDQRDETRNTGGVESDMDVWMQPSSKSPLDSPGKGRKGKGQTFAADSGNNGGLSTTATHPFENTVADVKTSPDSGTCDDVPPNSRFPDAITISSIAQHICVLLKPLIEGDLTNTTISDAVQASPGGRAAVVQSLLALRRKQALERGAKYDDAMAALMSKREKRSLKRRTRRGEVDNGVDTISSTDRDVDVGGSTNPSSLPNRHATSGSPARDGEIVGVSAAVAMLEAIAERQWNDQVTVQLRGARTATGDGDGCDSDINTNDGGDAGVGSGNGSAKSASINSDKDVVMSVLNDNTGVNISADLSVGTGIGTSMGSAGAGMPSERSRLSAGVFMRAMPAPIQHSRTEAHAEAQTHMYALAGTDMPAKPSYGVHNGDPTSPAEASGGRGSGGNKPCSTTTSSCTLPSSSPSPASTSSSALTTSTPRSGVGVASSRLVLRASARQRDALTAAAAVDTGARPDADGCTNTGTGINTGAGVGMGIGSGKDVAVGVSLNTGMSTDGGMGLGGDTSMGKSTGLGKDGDLQQRVWDYHIDGLPIPPPDTILSR